MFFFVATPKQINYNYKINSFTRTTMKFKIQFKINVIHFTNADTQFFIAKGKLLPESQDIVARDLKKTETLKKYKLTQFISVKGKHEHISQGLYDHNLVYEATGTFTYDEKYGFNFTADVVNEIIPEDDEKGLIAYLKKNIKRIGETKAKAIVKDYPTGKALIHLFEHEPNKLLNYKIKEAWLNEILTSWKTNRIFFKVRDYLSLINVSRMDEMANKLIRRFKEDEYDQIINTIKTSPYALVVRGFTLAEMDNFYRLSQKNDKTVNTTKEFQSKMMVTRHCAAVFCVLREEMALTGDTIIDKNNLINKVSTKAKVDKQDTENIVNQLVNRGKLLEHDGYITDYRQYNLEDKIANRIFELTETPITNFKFTPEKLELFKTKNEFKLDDSQMEACLSIFNSKISILTGGPGFGKTFTLNAITKTFEKNKLKVLLAAPTGKASQKMSKSIGRESSTLHRALKIGVQDEEMEFLPIFDKHVDFLDADIVIVDESSMIDLYLMSKLLERINPKRTSVLFVGDQEQLPPVNAGDAFKDFNLFPQINRAELKHLHRTAANNRIATGALSIKNNKLPDISEDPHNTLEMLDVANITETQKQKYFNQDVYNGIVEDLSVEFGNEIIDKIKENPTIVGIYGVFKHLVEQEEINPVDIQVITPRNTGELGVDGLNSLLKKLGNPNRVLDNSSTLKIGDKVMQIKNDPELQVFNGDTGIVIDIEQNRVSKDVKYLIAYDDREVEYNKEQIKNVKLAYSFTIHKSQGSDYPYVIMPLVNEHKLQWDKKLLYTGWTRTKSKLFLIGNPDIIEYAVHHVNNKPRKTNLEQIFKAK
jgi:helicase